MCKCVAGACEFMMIKTNCLLLDYGENVARHGCLDEVEPEAKYTR